MGRLIPYDRTWVHPTGGVRPFYRSYDDSVNWPHPLAGFTVVRDVPFTTKAGLDTAMAAITAGDYIHYTGTGILTISSSSASAYEFNAPQPTGLAIVDCGEGDTGNFVKFNCTSTSNGFAGAFVSNPKNVYFIGGSMTCPSGSYGILWEGGSNSGWYDFFIHDCGTDGMFVNGLTATGVLNNCRFRGEITAWGLVTAHDSHTTDPGSGIHGVQFSDSNQAGVTNCTIGVYVHDGVSGAGMQMGDSPSSVTVTGNTVFLRAENLSFASGVTSTSYANAIQLWGPAVQTGNVIGLIQAKTVQGQTVFTSSLTSASYDYTVKHARQSSTNLSGAYTTSYDVSKAGVVYQDTV